MAEDAVGPSRIPSSTPSRSPSKQPVQVPPLAYIYKLEEPDTTELSSPPSYTSSYRPSYRSVQVPSQAHTYTPPAPSLPRRNLGRAVNERARQLWGSMKPFVEVMSALPAPSLRYPGLRRAMNESAQQLWGSIKCAIMVISIGFGVLLLCLLGIAILFSPIILFVCLLNWAMSEPE